MDRKFVTAVTAGLLLLCLVPHIRAIEAEEDHHEDSSSSNYDYKAPVSRAESWRDQQRLYFQGDNFTVNLIPLVICGVILALMAVGAFLIIDLLLNGDQDDNESYGGGTGYGAPTTGYEQPSTGYGVQDSYGAAPAPQSYAAAPAPSYSAPAPAPSYSQPSSGYNSGYLKRTLNTAGRVEKALEEAQALYK